MFQKKKKILTFELRRTKQVYNHEISYNQYCDGRTRFLNCSSDAPYDVDGQGEGARCWRRLRVRAFRKEGESFEPEREVDELHGWIVSETHFGEIQC